ncbi:sodium:solute symporter family protein [Egicoccus sp. AB-alg2]|uniref:sodium:solute symporter family protein n=1 Tax=Egicoccus sp. AB-alg2 TaxID=3242693 RepID=UPI00359EFBE4
MSTTKPGADESAPPVVRDNPMAKLGTFAVIVAVGAVYIAVTDADVQWGGVVSMFVFYGVFYYLGAFVASRQTESLADTMVAGRGLPLTIAVFTMTATWVDGGYVNGTAEYAYSDGLAWVQAPWGYALSLIIGGIWFAPKMRRLEFFTMVDPIDVRFGKNLAGASFLPALAAELFWTGAILTALGTTFGTLLGIDFVPAILLSAAIAIAYTVVGGMWSVAYTDVAQIGIIAIGLALVLPFGLGAVGGYDTMMDGYRDAMGTYAGLFPPAGAWDHPDWGPYFWNWIDFGLLLVFGGIAWQVYFQRVLSAKDPKTARWLSIGAGLLAIFIAVPAALLGIVANQADFAAAGASDLETPALALPYVLRYLVPGIVGAIGLGAIAAAVMSSVDSSILSASTMSGWNVYRRLFRPQASDAQVQKVIKRMIVILGVTGTLIALNVQSVYALWFLGSDFVYVLVFPLLVCALFVPFANRAGAIAGFVVAAVLRLGGGDPTLGLPVWLPYPWIEDGVVLWPFRTFAMVSGFATILVVSKLTAGISPPVAMRALEPESPERRAIAEARG